MWKKTYYVILNYNVFICTEYINIVMPSSFLEMGFDNSVKQKEEERKEKKKRALTNSLVSTSLVKNKDSYINSFF